MRLYFWPLHGAYVQRQNSWCKMKHRPGICRRLIKWWIRFERRIRFSPDGLRTYYVSILCKQVYIVKLDGRLVYLILGQGGPWSRFVVVFWILVDGFSEPWHLQDPPCSYVWVGIQLWQSKRKMKTSSVEGSLLNFFEKGVRRLMMTLTPKRELIPQLSTFSR